MSKSARRQSKYKPHPGLAKEAEDKERLRAATGRSFEEWTAFAREKGPKEQRTCREWLSEKHGLGMRNAWWIAAEAVAPEGGPNYGDPDTLVDALYSGPKAALRPVHEKAVDAAIALGGDVIPTSCKTMVPIYRKHVFAELRPVAEGVEVGLALGDVPAKGRLLPTDGRQPGERLTHRVILRSEADVDAEFNGWLAKAYEAGADKIRRVETAPIPADLARELKASAKAAATWETCTPAMQRDWALWIEGAKQSETRGRRVAQAIERLAAGKKKNY